MGNVTLRELQRACTAALSLAAPLVSSSCRSDVNPAGGGTSTTAGSDVASSITTSESTTTTAGPTTSTTDDAVPVPGSSGALSSEPGMRRIARDELRHAALAFRISAWARRALGPRFARQLDAARHVAVEKACRAELPMDTEVATMLGWPGTPSHRILTSALAAVCCGVRSPE